MEMDDFERELKQSFLLETEHWLSDVEQCFLILEKNPHDTPTIEKIFRLAHSIKGSARASGFEEVSTFAHQFESFLAKVKNGEIPTNSDIVSLCLRTNDFFVKTVSMLKKDMLAKIDGSELLNEMNSYMNGERKFTQPVEEPPVEAPVAVVEAPVQEATISSERGASLVINEGDRFLSFTMGKENFAIPLLTVREVIAMPEFTSVPNTPEHFLGIMNLRGQVISLMDLRRKFGIKSENTPETAVIICNLNTICVGVVVDSIDSVLAPELSDISPKPDIHSSKNSNYICGVYHKENQLTLFLDIAESVGVARLLESKAA